jgi:hypothetical protein
MQLTARMRFVLARRPWIYWTIVALLAAGAAAIVHAELTAIGERRDAWGTTRRVLVADGDLEPGAPFRVREVTLPAAAVPPSALDELPAHATLRQRVADGEVLVAVDVVRATGPAARADDGTVVVALVDPLMRGVRSGERVQVAAAGQVIADDATVVDIVDDVAFVAVPPDDAARVADAAQTNSASLLYVP